MDKWKLTAILSITALVFYAAGTSSGFGGKPTKVQLDLSNCIAYSFDASEIEYSGERVPRDYFEVNGRPYTAGVRDTPLPFPGMATYYGQYTFLQGAIPMHESGKKGYAIMCR